ncbi:MULTISPECIES: ligase-associated DNA damage response endonuclease PdeM [Myxococcus]|uniref:Metallophosphatase n=1 Tax=Myxococcus xanthus TaxID=34 RepID=A0AAE6KV91_MYXXA|nr:MULTISPECIES: ligase-associated DNA damage response endonuclease PdeM [Myxococcus]QDE70945.1 metallophosphatase [Myxococcus xanthus]QDE78224.1 metallophosphatase [Myxococcus xanthus]QDF07500.1 metallophosphatase [Myxococcus xanthus]WAM25104.1 ligase-associated DNA damage response endonuclease PdeM [Myxococcus sp. NMCA1]
MDARRCQVHIEGTLLELRPERALYWPDTGTLAVADLHWGKTESFQQHGIPLPTGVLEDDLARLSAALTTTGARRLLLLGDLIHSRQGLTPAVVERLAVWRESHASVECVLVRGNHDRHVKTLPDRWRLDVRESSIDEGPFHFAHHPEPVSGRYVWAGHLHPMVRLGGRSDTLRLPCFQVGRGVGVLPAFSAFTGGLNVSRRAGDRIFAVAGPAVVEV